MAKKKQEVKPIEYTTCKGIAEINGFPMDKNPAHQVARHTMTRIGMCLFCRGVFTQMSRWYGKQEETQD